MRCPDLEAQEVEMPLSVAKIVCLQEVLKRRSSSRVEECFGLDILR